MTGVKDPPALNPDGTPQRRYEIEPQEESKIGLRASIGLVLANGFVLLRNVLFESDAAAAPSVGAAKPEQGHIEEEIALAANTSNAGEKIAPEADEPGRRGSGSLSTLFSSQEQFYPDPSEPVEIQVTRSPLPPRPLNDNEALYAAPPGASVTLGNGDSPPPVGASPGGGGASRPLSGGLEDGSGDPDSTGSSPGSGSDFESGDNHEEDGDDKQNQAPRLNRLPVVTAPVILADLVSNQSVVIALSDLLQHAHDPDGDTLVVHNLTSSSGTLAQRSDGSWLFTPETDDVSDVSFSYAISDGHGEVAQTAFLDLVPPALSLIIGTPGTDTLVGTPQNDVIEGLDGDDVIHGREGNDVILGGSGNDRLLGGEGDDVIYGGDGDDVVFAGAGNDVVMGGNGNDVILGEEGDDRLFGEDGNDLISGGPGNDVIFGGAGDDRLYGDDGNDVMDGGDGDDLIEGGAGNDIAFGGNGDDVFVGAVGDGDDVYDGGEGSDTYDASAGTADLIVDLGAGTATSSELGADTLLSIENVVGGSGNDTLIANDEVNILTGGPGEDVFVFRSSKAAGKGKGSRDKILDFEVGDRIDLDDISEEFADAFEDTFKEQGIRRFVLIEQQEEFSKPGQIRFKYDTIDDKPVTVVQGNIDFDPDVEFEIELAGHYQLKDSDFYGAA